ncbi:MAG: PaaI family thioesterase [Pseudomonadota bacterium]
MELSEYNEGGAELLPGLLGIELTHVEPGEARAHIDVQKKHLALNGYLHAGAVITLADTAAGYGCMATLPDGATGFTTIELKSNHLSTATEGVVSCVSECVHRGRTTQVWTSEVRSELTGRTIARFTCTQMILYPR